MEADRPRKHLWLYIEEPLLAVPPDTDWDEVRRTRRPPRRLAPDRDDMARQVIAMLLDEGWADIEVRHQEWDDHPQVGKAWWISVDGVPPAGTGLGQHDAWMFKPGPVAPTAAAGRSDPPMT